MKNILPGRDEVALGPAIAKHVEDTANERRAINRSILIGNFHSIHLRENVFRIVHLALSGQSAKGFRKVEMEQDIANVEEKRIYGRGGWRGVHAAGKRYQSGFFSKTK